MSDSDRQMTAEGDLEALEKLARLDLAATRAGVVAPALNGVMQLFDALDAVDLGETPPTNSFEARWRDLP